MNMNYNDDSDFFFPDLSFDHFDFFWDFEIEIDSDSDVKLDSKKTPIDNAMSMGSYSYNDYLANEAESEDFPF